MNWFVLVQMLKRKARKQRIIQTAGSGFEIFRDLNRRQSYLGWDQLCCVCYGTRWAFRAPPLPIEGARASWWQKERAGPTAVWHRDPVQTLFCRLAHEARLVRKTALLSITQHLSVLTVLGEIVCTHESDTHVHNVWGHSCPTRDAWHRLSDSDAF